MNRHHESDEWLMAEVVRGDRERLGTLLRRYASPLLTFIQRMIGDRHRAEELFQEVFLAVWTRRRTYEPQRRFRPWLYGIAVNKCRADFRKRTRLPVVFDEASAEPLTSADPSPAEAAIAAETATVVAAAVTRLPEAQRTVLVMRIWNGLSYGEIAESLDLAQATVRSHMFHALAAVRRYLEPRLK